MEQTIADKQDSKARSGSFEELVNDCVDPKTGAIDLLKIQGRQGRYGHNGGVGCDVLMGPCSCGAWH